LSHSEHTSNTRSCVEDDTGHHHYPPRFGIGEGSAVVAERRKSKFGRPQQVVHEIRLRAELNTHRTRDDFRLHEKNDACGGGRKGY
jgi:hypothetical protein